MSVILFATFAAKSGDSFFLHSLNLTFGFLFHEGQEPARLFCTVNSLVEFLNVVFPVLLERVRCELRDMRADPDGPEGKRRICLLPLAGGRRP